MNYNYDKVVGKRIRALRMKKGITQDALAAKLQVLGCDISRAAISKIESGARHIYLYELKFIKQVLNVDYNDLLK